MGTKEYLPLTPVFALDEMICCFQQTSLRLIGNFDTPCTAARLCLIGLTCYIAFAMRDQENFKQMLGSVAEKYTSAQIQELRRQMYGMADLLLDIYLTGEKQLGGVDVDSLRGTMKSERSKNEPLLG